MIRGLARSSCGQAKGNRVWLYVFAHPAVSNGSIMCSEFPSQQALARMPQVKHIYHLIANFTVNIYLTTQGDHRIFRLCFYFV